jgi:hypothetical protein
MICHALEYDRNDSTRGVDQDNARWWIPDLIPGLGSVAVIYWRPSPMWSFDTGDRCPAFITLAHELVHARRMLLGICHVQDRRVEELHTVGLSLLGSPEGVTLNDKRGWGAITENDIRAEHGLPRRIRYTFRDGALKEEFLHLAPYF